MRTILLSVALGVGYGSAYAQGVCKELEYAVEHSKKLIARYELQGILDDSAPREIIRQLEINNTLQLLNYHSGLMAQNRCSPTKESFSTSSYQHDALKCSAEGSKNPEACNTSKWTRK
jgi:hypothetical protein